MTNEKRTFRQLLDQLGERRDEIRVQLHLAGMDIKNEWDALEGKLRGLAKLEELEDEARLQAHLGKMEAEDELEALGKTLDKIVDNINWQTGAVSRELKDAVDMLSKRVRSYREHYKKSA